MNRITLTLVLVAGALTGAVLGSTPVGHAAARMVLPAGSVGMAQVKANAITSAKVKNGSLVLKDFKAGQLPAGPRGPKGDKGEPGPAGSLQKSPAGGALAGAYPNPKLAADAVGSSQVSDRSLRLEDTAVANGQVHVDLPSVPPFACIKKAVSIPGRHGSDLLVLEPTPNLSTGIVVTPIFDVDAGPWFEVRACNVTRQPLDAPDGAWGYALYR